MEGNNTYLEPPEVRRQVAMARQTAADDWLEQAANVSSGRATEKETKSFAFDKSYWCVALC